MDPQLEQYIKSQLAAGYPPDAVKQALISSGYDPAQANALVSQALPPPEPQKTQPPQMPAVKKPEKKPVKWDTPPIPKWAVIVGLIVATVVFMYLFYTFVITTMPA